MSYAMTIEFVPQLRVFDRAAWPLTLEPGKFLARENESISRVQIKTQLSEIKRDISANVKQEGRKIKTLFDIRSLIEADLRPQGHSMLLPDWHGPPGSAA